MPEKKTIERAEKDKAEGKAPTTQAGEFVRRKSNTSERANTARGRRSRRLRSDYRKRAEECLEIAQTARTPEQRTMLLHIAETWMNLARDAESNSSVRTAEGSGASLN